MQHYQAGEYKSGLGRDANSKEKVGMRSDPGKAEINLKVEGSGEKLSA